MNKQMKFYNKPWFAASAIVLVFILILSYSVNAIWNSTVGRIAIKSDSNLNLTEEEIKILEKETLTNPIPYDKDVTNILLLGVDSRDKKDIKTRSDAMLILTINQKQKKLKLTSLQRDMLVPMPSQDTMDKLNHANVFGGPEYVMRTVNGILRLDIDRYAVVNIRSLEIIIDMMGGVEIDVSEEAAPFLEGIIRDQNAVFSDTPPVSEKVYPGLQVLNGRQGVAYARNRSTAGSDYDRMDYQKELLQAMFTKFLDISLSEKLKVFSEALSHVTTNLSRNEMLGMLQSVLPILDKEIETLTIPVDGYNTHYSGDVWLNLCDFNGMIPILQEFMYGQTFPFDPVPEIPGAPNSSTQIEQQIVEEWSIETENNMDNYYNEYTEPTYYVPETNAYDSEIGIVNPGSSGGETSVIESNVPSSPVEQPVETQPPAPSAVEEATP